MGGRPLAAKRAMEQGRMLRPHRAAARRLVRLTRRTARKSLAARKRRACERLCLGSLWALGNPVSPRKGVQQLPAPFCFEHSRRRVMYNWAVLLCDTILPGGD